MVTGMDVENGLVQKNRRAMDEAKLCNIFWVLREAEF